MDIPLPDEIPLPGGGDDNQPGPPGEGPPPRPVGMSHFQRPPGPQQGPQMVHQPRPPSAMLIPPPMFRGPMPPFRQAPPHNRPSEESTNSRSSSERYSPSRVTGDDDEKEQLSISAIFAQEENLPHSQSLPPMPSQSNSQPQQSISAIFDSFLAPPPQAHHPIHPHGHEHHGHRYPHMPPRYPMGSQPPPHGPHSSGPPNTHAGPHHSGPHAPYYIRPPPYQPYTQALVNRPPYAPIYTPASDNTQNRPYKPPSRSNTSYFQSSKSKASKILKSFNTQNALYSRAKDDAPADSETAIMSSSETLTSTATETTPSTLDINVSAVADSSLGTASAISSNSETHLLESSDVSVSGTEVLDTKEQGNSASTDSASVGVTSGPIENNSLKDSEKVPLTASEASLPSLMESMSKVAAETASENAATEVTEKPIKKTLPKVLGKHGAKKRLLSYTGKLSAFSLTKATKQTTSTSLEDDDDSNEKKKSLTQIKKKKKEEKMSSIEQIRNEESRIKEALGLKNVLFSPYGPGLAPIAKLLDNPEELRKFEDRGKQAKIKLEEYEVRSKIRERDEKKKDKEKVKLKEKEPEKEKEKEKDKENEKVEDKSKLESLSATVEEPKTDVPAKTIQEEVVKKSSVLPKTWKDFKAENYDFETLRQAVREDQRKRRSRSHDRTRGHGGYGRDRNERNKSRQSENACGQQNPPIYSVQLITLNGMRVQYPGKMVQYTKTIPSLSYGINYHRYNAHYSSRLEIKVREPSEHWEIMKDLWSAKPVYPRRKKHGKSKGSRPWFRESLEGKTASKSKVLDASKGEEVVKQKTEKKSKKSHSRRKVADTVHEVPQIVDVKTVDQEVAKIATKSKWDSDNEEGEIELPEIDEDHEELPLSKVEGKNSTEDGSTIENEVLSSDNTISAEVGESNDTSGKAFPEGLNEEYEAFLEILGGGSETKDGQKEEGREMIAQEDDSELADKDKNEEIDEKEVIYQGDSEDNVGKKIVREFDLDGKYMSEEEKEGEEEEEEGEEEEVDKPVEKVEQDKKKDKADKKLKKQLKKAKKKQKRAKKKAKKKAKKVTKKKKISKKETKKSDKKVEVAGSQDESDASVIHVKDDELERNSERRKRETDDSRDNSEERVKEYSDRRRNSVDRSSEERSEYLERRRRDSPERRGEYDHRREYEDRRDFSYRRDGNNRGYFRGRGGDWRRDDFGDFRGRYRGRGGYDRRGRGRGFVRNFNFRDRRDSYRERRPDYGERREEDRVYERTEDYEVHREFIREKRYERKEALEEGRDLRKERQEKLDYDSKRGKYDKERKVIDDMDDMLSYSPARTLSDESSSSSSSDDDDIKHIEHVRDDKDKGKYDKEKEVYSRSRREKKSFSPAPSPSPSPEIIRKAMKDVSEDDSEEELKMQTVKKSKWELEDSNTSPSWKSRDSSPAHIIEDLTGDDDKVSVSTRYATSETSGYYDLSSAPSPLSEPDLVKIDGEESSKHSHRKGRKGKKDVDIKLDDIPYPPGGPPVADKKEVKSKSRPVSDRYSPSNMSMSGSPSSSSPNNSPSRSHSPALEIPLPPAVQNIPVPPIVRSSDLSTLKSESKGISIPPAGIPLPSGPPYGTESTENSKPAMSLPVPVAAPGKIPVAPVNPPSILSQLSGTPKSLVPPSSVTSSPFTPGSATTLGPPPIFTSLSKTYPEMKDTIVCLSEDEDLENIKPASLQTFKSQDPFKSSKVQLFPSAVSDSKTLEHLDSKKPVIDLREKKSVTDLREKTRNEDADGIATKWVEKSADESYVDETVNEDRGKSSRSVPITFRLGGSKQATIKRLQKGSLLPEFDHEEEEEEKAGLELERVLEEESGKGETPLDEEDRMNETVIKDSSVLIQSSKSSPPSSPKMPNIENIQQVDEAKEVAERFERSRSRSLEKPLTSVSRSPQRSRSLSQKDISPRISQSPDRSKSPKGSRTHYKNKSPLRNRSPVRSRSPQRNRSPKRNRSPRRARDSRSRSWSPRRMGGRRSPPRKRRVSPEYRRYRGSPERGRRREFGSPRRAGRWPRDGRSPPPRSAVPRGGKDRRSPKRFSRSPSPLRDDRFASPPTRHSRSPEKVHVPVAQGPRTPEEPDKDPIRLSPGRLASPHRERDFRGNYKGKLTSRSPDRPPSPEVVGRRPSYASPQGRKNRKDYRSSISPSSRSPERWVARRHSPSRRSPKWSPERQRGGSPGWRSPPYRSPERRSQYSPGGEKLSPVRRWSSRSRSPRRSPLRKSPLRRPQIHRSTSRSPIRRSRSRTPIHRSASRSPVRRSPIRRSPRWSRSPSRRSPVRRSPVRRSPSRRSPARSPGRRSPIRRSPLRRSPSRRSPVRKSPLRKSPRRSPRSSHSPSNDFEYERHERGSWNNWKWEKEQEGEHKEQERWPIRPPSPKNEPSREKYYKKKVDRKEGTLKIDADSTISDSELTIKKEPVDSPSSSPPESPRRLSLDERLQQEHGVEVEDHSKKRRQKHSQAPLYNWGYQAHPVQVHQFQYAYEGNSEGMASENGGNEGSSRVIQVGNMLQVLPQDPGTTTTPSPMIVQQVLPQDAGTTATPSPMIVQAGNVIQVVPAENMQMLGADVVPGIPVSGSSVMGMGGVVQVVTGGMMGMTGSSPTPVPAPVTSTSSTSKSASEESSATVSSVLSSLSSAIQLPGASALTSSSASVSHISQSSTVTPVTTLATNSVTATTSTHAAGLPVAHLISLLQQQQMASVNESTVDQESKAAKEKAREERRERKEKRRLEREARREARQKEKDVSRRKREDQESHERDEDNENSDTEDEVLIREAIYEVPNIGSPVPEYEIMNEEEEDDDDEDSAAKKRRRLPVPLPPAEKGILMSPSYRYREEYHPKAVKFADGILPGEGTSPSGGEEIHSPPPPGATNTTAKPREKKLRKRRKVKVKIIKQYNVNDEDDDSPPPPPPGSPPPLAALKLYPGYTHYSYTAPGTVVIYAQQPQQAYAYAAGQAQGAVTVPGGMVIQQGANTPQQAALGNLGGLSPGVLRYPGYVYTTVYSAGQQLQYVLQAPITSQATTSSPQKTSKK